MIPEFVKKHYAFKHGCSLAQSEKLHLKLELYFGEVMEQGVVAPTPEVDKVWHNFILHIKLYREHCFNYYGKFIHHNPIIPDNVDELILNNTITKANHMAVSGKCDNQCNGGAKCDNQCNGGNKWDNQCNGGSWCESTT